jgi:hypothetical protein
MKSRGFRQPHSDQGVVYRALGGLNHDCWLFILRQATRIGLEIFWLGLVELHGVVEATTSTAIGGSRGDTLGVGRVECDRPEYRKGTTIKGQAPRPLRLSSLSFWSIWPATSFVFDREKHSVNKLEIEIWHRRGWRVNVRD